MLRLTVSKHTTVSRNLRLITHSKILMKAVLFPLNEGTLQQISSCILQFVYLLLAFLWRAPRLIHQVEERVKVRRVKLPIIRAGDRNIQVHIT